MELLIKQSISLARQHLFGEAGARKLSLGLKGRSLDNKEE
jgi:hypothetical protein